MDYVAHMSTTSLNVSTVDGALENFTLIGVHDGTAVEIHKSIDRYSSLDSSDTFLSCNTHPFPSQGSLAGLEEMAALGTMAANGSMPAVNISTTLRTLPVRSRSAGGIRLPSAPSTRLSWLPTKPP